jgi:benzoyl-CoA reductase subunit D
MVAAGIDCGAKTVKVVLMKDGQIISKNLVMAGIDAKASVNEAFDEALRRAGLTRDHVDNIVATGAGKKEVTFAKDSITEVAAAAKGAIYLNPAVRTVVDVGAEEGRAIKVDESSKVVDFAINEKCAAGAGAFTEAMARALEVRIEDMGPLSMKSTQVVPMNAQCAVFAESELVTLVHSKVPKPDMARAIHDAIADRIISMIRRVGIEKEILLIGGVAHNIGFVDSMRRGLGTNVVIPKDPEFVGALGAALAAGGK